VLATIAAAARRDRRRLHEHPGRWAVAVGLAAQSLLLLLAIVKHPTELYTQAIAAVLPVLMAIAFTCWHQYEGAVRVACAAVAAAVIASLGVWYPNRIATFDALYRTVGSGVNQAKAALRERGGADRQLRLWTAGTGSPCFALWLADLGTGRAFDREIAARCPRDGLAWYGSALFPTWWASLPPDSASAYLVTVERTLEADPRLSGWGPAETLAAESLESGRFVLVPFDPRRLRGGPVVADY
jgi:hypothetical protein